MNTKTKSKSHSETATPNPTRHHSVRYYWSSAGAICSGHTVAEGKTRSAALSAFFTDHPHVTPEPA